MENQEAQSIDAGIVSEGNEAAPVVEQKPEVTENIPSEPDVSQEDESPDADSSEEGKPKKKQGWLKKLERAEQELAKARAEIAKEREETERLKASLPKPVEKPKTPGLQEGEPDPADYVNTLDYVRDLAKWDNKQELLKFESERESKAQEAKQLESFHKKVESYSEKVNALKETRPDFQSKVDEAVEAGLITDELEVAVVNSDLNIELAEYLLDNPDELEKISDLSGVRLMNAISRLEGRLEARKSSEPAAVRTTRAPAPITPVRQKASTSTGYDPNMDQRAFEKMMGLDKKYGA